jgi:sulfur relay protein TusB/DsrH
MVRTAFLALRSPQEQDLSEMISRLSSREDASVILFEDAVYNALDARYADRLKSVAAVVRVARDDLEARGFIEADLKTGNVVDYDGIVDLVMERTDRTVTL